MLLIYGMVKTWKFDWPNKLHKINLIRSFKKCGISNLMDGTEDHLIYEDDDIENNNDNNDPEIVDDEDSSADW